MKRIIAFILLAVMLLGSFAPAAYATEETAAETEATEAEEETLGGWMSDGFRWELEDGTLTITGEGTMPGEAPWREYAQQIETVFFDGNIYTVAAGAFRNCHMIKEIQFSNALTEIGEYAFQSCKSIKQIHLPDTFRKFGTMCFADCTSLTRVYCQGYMPRFEESCLWNGGEITVYYAPEKPWKADDVKTLERNFGGRLEVLCTDGTDPVPDEDGQEQPQTEATEEETVPQTTATVPATVATEPPAIPETTVPETTAVETTVPETTEVLIVETVPEPTVQLAEPTEPAAIEENTVKGGFMGLVLVVGILTFFIVGALVFKIRSRSGKY